jgi:hypothetical protein
MSRRRGLSNSAESLPSNLASLQPLPEKFGGTPEGPHYNVPSARGSRVSRAWGQPA